MEKQNKTPGSVFAVINLADTEEQQQTIIRYSADYALAKGLTLVLYPQREGTKLGFEEARRQVIDLRKRNSICASIVKKEPGIFGYIGDLAKKASAELIVISIGQEQPSFLKKLFGQNVWNITRNTGISVMLIKDTVFDSKPVVTIAVDSNRNFQKLRFLAKITDIHHSTIHLFVERTDPDDTIKAKKIRATLGQIEEYLSRNDVAFEVEVARSQMNYSTNLLKFAAKKSGILLIEVDEGGNVPSELQKNIQKILFANESNFAVMLVKTHNVAITSWR